MAAPVFDRHGAVAALCLTIPETRFQAATEARLARTLMQQAEQFSTALGWRGSASGAA
jgi:DNA-binding IclR family transcriptional regulator